MSLEQAENVKAMAALLRLHFIAGALIAGFLLLDWLGLWRSIQLMAGVYLWQRPLRVETGLSARFLEGTTALKPTVKTASITALGH
jgi:hypothetical protein